MSNSAVHLFFDLVDDDKMLVVIEDGVRYEYGEDEQKKGCEDRLIVRNPNVKVLKITVDDESQWSRDDMLKLSMKDLYLEKLEQLKVKSVMLTCADAFFDSFPNLRRFKANLKAVNFIVPPNQVASCVLGLKCKACDLRSLTTHADYYSVDAIYCHALCDHLCDQFNTYLIEIDDPENIPRYAAREVISPIECDAFMHYPTREAFEADHGDMWAHMEIADPYPSRAKSAMSNLQAD